MSRHEENIGKTNKHYTSQFSPSRKVNKTLWSALRGLTLNRKDVRTCWDIRLSGMSRSVHTHFGTTTSVTTYLRCVTSQKSEDFIYTSGHLKLRIRWKVFCVDLGDRYTSSVQWISYRNGWSILDPRRMQWFSFSPPRLDRLWAPHVLLFCG